VVGGGAGGDVSGRAASDVEPSARGSAVTEPRGSSGPGLDGGADSGVDVTRTPDVGPPPITDSLAVPCTGCWSSASTRPPISHASITTASTEAAAATARRRQYTDCGSGPFGSIMDPTVNPVQGVRLDLP
jgi:hypothetical protein